MLLRVIAPGSESMLVGGGTSILSPPLLRTLQHATSLGLRFSTLGTGVDDASFFGQLEPAALLAWRDVFASSEHVGVRGPESVAALRELGVENPRMVGDPAVVLARETPPVVDDGQVVGINVGTAYGAVWGGDEERAVDAVTQLALSLRRAGWSVRLFSVWPPDTAIAVRMAQQASLGPDSVLAEYVDGRRLAEALGHCDVFVGMKLHSQILAICAGVPTVAIEYQPKTSDFMSSIGATSEVARIDSLSAAGLREWVEHVSLRRAEIARRQWDGCRRLAEVFLSYVADLGGSSDELARWVTSY
jgi:polysaccharide pyruvyl transferase WcaK-like protein